jgi:hypothetical protein
MTTTYQFDELSEEAQKRAISQNWDWNTNDQWWYEDIIDDAKEIGKLLGIDIDNVWWSGFASQGDGACFTGRYSYVKGSCKAVRDYAPKDEELHRIADALREAQRRAFYQLYASVKHRGHYQHENCTDIDVDGEYGDIDPDAIAEPLRDFMRWIYRRLEEEYYYQNEDEQIAESFRANETEFTENGELY